MKPIEECLDIILDQLKANWNVQPYPPLDAEALIGQFEVPLGRHEFFKGLIRMLVEDGYAYFIEDYKPHLPAAMSETDYFKSKTMLTPRGLYFQEADGYRAKALVDASENNRLRALETSQHDIGQKLNALTGWIAGGTIVLALIELAKWFEENHWWPFCGK